MSLIVRLIAKYALWIYILCGLGMIVYLRAALAARQQGAQTIFPLDRETAVQRVYRSSGMIVVLLLIVVGVYALSNYVEVPSPSQSPIAWPTATVEAATPTRSLPSPTPGTPTVTVAPTATRRPFRPTVILPTIGQGTPTVQTAPASCPRPNVQVFQPGQNQVINQGTEVKGIATKEGFDRYEFKFKSRDAQDEWHWVQSFKTPVQNGSLGFWPTSHLPAGNYSFMLIVIDRTGNSEECIVPVAIQH